MKDYSTGKIYKIVNSVNDCIYIGSTCAKLSERMRGHRCACKNPVSPFYKKMKEVGVEYFRIILVKEFPCDNYEQLLAEEYRVMKEMKDNGIELYNINFGTIETHPWNGKHHTEEAKERISEAHKGKTHSEESKKKMSDSKKGEKNHFYGKRGGEIHNFKYGFITKREINKNYYWVYCWRENGKKNSKCFSVNKYGHEQAIELCVEHRSKIYPNYQPKYVEIFFLD
jgi:group I intron endonuclease